MNDNGNPAEIGDALPGKSELLLAWFCLRAKTKHEHIAAAALRQEQLEAFAPRIRFRRKTSRGPSWFVEALFPGYLFCRLNWGAHHKMVQHTTGVLGIVHFGDQWPTVPDDVMSELRSCMEEQEMRTIEAPLTSGAEVQVLCGAFEGLRGIVTQVVKSEERVRVLLDFLGRQTSVELPATDVLNPQTRRAVIS